MTWRDIPGYRGERHGKTKLSNVDVEIVRHSKDSRDVLSKRFNISKTHISRIRQNRSRIWED